MKLGSAIACVIWGSALAKLAAADVAVELGAEAGVAFEYGAESEMGASDAYGNELFLAKLKIENAVLEDIVSVYRYQGRTYVPLLALARLLEIPLRQGPVKGMIVGYVLEKDRVFRLNVSRGEAVVGGKVFRFDPKLVVVRPEDTYVATELLSQWLPTDFEFDPYAALLIIKPREPLPMQLRAERERRWARVSAWGASAEPNYPRYANPYKLLDGPALDLNAVTGYNRNAAGESRFGLSYGLYGSGDLLYLETNAYVAGSDTTPLSDVRLTAGRKDFYGRLLGPLQAREAWLGDVYIPGLNGISTGGIARGGYVSNYPWYRQTEIDSHSFVGNLPQGWEVELYQDHLLIGFRKSDQSGLYRFEQIPLRVGANSFRLVFYGPYGQRREERYAFNIADALTEPGDLRYRAAAGAVDAGGVRAMVQAETGILKGLTASLSGTAIPLQGETRGFLVPGLRGYAGPVYGFLQTALQDDGGTGLFTGGQMGFHWLNVSVDYSRLLGLETEIFPVSTDPLSSRIMTRFEVFTPADLLPASVGFTVSRDGFASGRRSLSFSNQVAATIQEASVSHQLTAVWPDREAAMILSGALLASRRMYVLSNVGVNGQAAYRITPDFEWLSAALSFDRTFGRNLYASTGLSYLFTQRQTSWNVNLNKTAGEVAVGLGVQFFSDGSYSALLRLATSVGHVSQQNAWYTDARPMGQTGAILARVFLDGNLNGRWDPGEKPLTGVGLFVNAASSEEKTGRDGMLYISHLPAHIPCDVSIATSTLEDPAYLPTRLGVRIEPRPGKPMVVEFPIIHSSEIDGFVYLQTGALKTELADVEVELVDARGVVVKREKSAYDGYFLFSGVVPGTYRVRASESQALAAGLIAPAEVLAEARPGQPVQGIEIVLREPVPGTAP